MVGYALSESPYGLIWPRGQRPYGTLGAARQHPYLGTINEAKVVADEPEGAGAGGGASAGAGSEVAPGGTGELWLRNPVVTPGYWGMPEETASVLPGPMPAFLWGMLQSGLQATRSVLSRTFGLSTMKTLNSRELVGGFIPDRGIQSDDLPAQV